MKYNIACRHYVKIYQYFIQANIIGLRIPTLTMIIRSTIITNNWEVTTNTLLI